MYQSIRTEVSGHVGILWLSRPDARNAMDSHMWNEIPVAMAAFDEEETVRAVIIQGEGPSFTAGIDLKEFGASMAGDFSKVDGSAVRKRLDEYDQIKRLQASFTSIADSRKPAIAAIHGACIGAGVDLITACDIRIASEDAVFSVRETKLGLVADVGTMQRLPRVIGAGQAAELIYTGKDINAEEALSFGLINRVLPTTEELHKAAMDLATEIATNSPLTTQGAKHILKMGQGRTVAEALDYMALWNAAFLHSDDIKEAMVAYMEKRPPDFKGQ